MSGKGASSMTAGERTTRALVRALVAVAAIVAAPPLEAQWEGEVRAQGRVFGQAAAGRDLPNPEGELIFTGGYYRDWEGGRQAITVQPLLRLDPNGESTRFDFRELSWQYRWARWALRVGFDEVFWGVSESQHLVDVINQRDVVVGGQGYVKMGQPQIGVSTRQVWGSLELVLMPYFRERTFAGRAGTLWSPVPVVADDPQYESAARNWHLDVAIRWSHTLGAWDVGVTQFVGTNRDPRFVSDFDAAGQPTLMPYYDVISQTAVDVQWTQGSWLWKFEAVTLDPAPGRYLAVVGGLEYVVADYLSVFGEYAYDSRGAAATTSFDDDLFAGAQLLLQDGRVRAGAYIDRQTQNSVVSIQAERRLSEVSLLALELGAFLGKDSLEPPHARRQHDYLSLYVIRYF